MTGLLGEGLIKIREKENGHVADQKPRLLGDRAFSRHDIELRAGQPPPRARQAAGSDEAVVENIAVLQTLRPFSLKDERVRRGKNARPGVDFGRRRSPDVVKLALLSFEIVFGAIAKENLAAGEVFVVDMAASLGLTGLRVVVDLVRFQQQVSGFQFHAAAEEPLIAQHFLRDASDHNVVRTRRIGSLALNSLVRFQGYGGGDGQWITTWVELRAQGGGNR